MVRDEVVGLVEGSMDGMKVSIDSPGKSRSHTRTSECL